MKSLIKIIASILTAVLLLSPISALAATSVPWTIQNITDTFISPGLVNGLFKGIFVTASSTIGDGTLGLTINGGATTTGNALFAGNLSVTGSTILTGTLTQTGLATFTNGLISQASSTIGSGTLGLTVNGNSTTTGTAFFNGNVGIGSTTPFGKLSITNMGSSPSIAIEGGNIIQVASSTPVVVGSVTDSSLNVPRNMTISGNYAYITSTVSNSLTIVDVSSSTAPRVLTSTTTTQYLNFPTGVAVSGNYAYVAGRTVNRLTVFDVSNPSSITEVGSVTNAGSLNTPNSVAVSGSYAYVAGSGNSLTVVNIADPTNPTIVGFIIDNVLLNNARAVVVSGKYAYVAAAFNGSVTVIDISRPDAPIIVGSVTDNTATLRGVVSLAKSGSYLYAIASTTKTFTAIDVSNPTAPTIAGSLVDARFNNGNSGSSGSMISVAGNYAYVAGSSGDLITVDISNPAAPRFVSALHDVTNFQNALAIGVSGRYAYIIGTISTHFTVVDLNNSLQTPTIQTGSISTDNINVKGSMTVAGDILSNGGLNVGLSGIFSRGGIFVSAASSTAANPIAGLFMNGSVGIGTTSPWTALSVEGTSSLGNQAIAGFFTATSTMGTSTFAGSIAVGTTGTTSRVAILESADDSAILRLMRNTGQYLDFSEGANGHTFNAYSTINNAKGLIFNATTDTSNSAVTGGAVTYSFQVLGTEALNVASSSTTIRNNSTGGTTGTANTGGLTLMDLSSGSTWDTTNPFTALTFNSQDGSGAGAGGRARIGTVMTDVGGASSRLAFYTTPTTANTYSERMTILANGNVGVGTTSPWRTFSVNGTVGFSGLSSGSGSNLCLSSSNELVTCTVSASASYPFALSGNATSTLTQFNAGLTAFASSTIGDGTQIGGLTVSGGATTTGNAYFANTVGIASTSPWAGLSVDTTGLAVGMPSFSVGSSTRQDFLITQSGRIDIGTTTDPYTTAVAIPLLNVAGSIQIGKAGQTFNGLDIVRNDGVSGTGLLEWSGSTTFQLTNGSGGGILRLGAVSSAGGSIQFLGNSSSLLGTIVNSTGFFGIGTTTPWGQISASSTSANPTLAIEQHGSGPAGIFIGGNVGIGTTSPFLKLAVIGSFGVATSTNSGLPNFEIDTSGHTLTSGSPPTFGACGTNPNFVGPANDTDMTINIGSGVVSSCTINFALSYPTNATVGCSLSQIGGSFATSIESSTTPAAVVINGGTITSDRYYLHCQASQ